LVVGSAVDVHEAGSLAKLSGLARCLEIVHGPTFHLTVLSKNMSSRNIIEVTESYQEISKEELDMLEIYETQIEVEVETLP